MNKERYDKYKEIDSRSFLKECKISIPHMYKNNLEMIQDNFREFIYGLGYMLYIIPIILRILFILTSPVSFPLGILVGKLVLKYELRKYKAEYY